MNSLSVKHLIGIKDLSEEDISLIFSTADNFKSVINRPIKKVPLLEILPLLIYFLKILLVQNCPLNLLKRDCLQIW